MNLILATIYNNYKTQTDNKARQRAELKEEAVTVAFHLLDIHGADTIEVPICVSGRVTLVGTPWVGRSSPTGANSLRRCFF
jgi:hypothetical protein|eukprot:COSAG01_NODE_1578_length_9832_cov_75.363403_3_plen_81_part_00